jgi:hypothetical protein
MSKITAYLFIFSLAAQNIYSFDTTAAKFYPLNIGNIYIYRESHSSPYGTYITYFRTTIEKDSVFNNHRYFLFREFPSGYKVWKRIDSLTNNIMRYDSSNSCPFYLHDIFVDSLSARLGDHVSGACTEAFYNTCSDTNNVTIFGITSQYKAFGYVAPHAGGSHYFARNIGFYKSSSSAEMFSQSTLLTGCVLKGVAYGDTTMPVGIKQINTEVPGDFELYQNYPNPFNPSTLIKYSIKKEAHVILKIYGLTGKEVSVPVNQLLQPGTYSTEFNASGYSSGVYFYRMEVFGINGKALYSESRKMLIVK